MCKADEFIDRELAAHESLGEFPKGKFSSGQYIRHVASGKLYQVIISPDSGMRIESTGEPAYLYDPAFCLLEDANRQGWVRSMTEMEDGRFVDASKEVTMEIHSRYIQRREQIPKD